MEVFKIRPGGFTEIRKKMLLRTIPMLTLAAAVGITIAEINSKPGENNINTLPIVIPVAILAMGFGLYRSANRQKSIFESYTLTITNNLVTREQLNTPKISLYTTEILEITRNKNGSITIKGKDPADIIYIPAQIDHYPQLELALQQIKPIVTKKHVSFLQKYQAATTLLTLALMVCVYTVNNKWIVALTGTPLVSLMVWSFVQIRKSKNIDNKTKRVSWWFILVVASVIGVMIFKLTAPAGMQHH